MKFSRVLSGVILITIAAVAQPPDTLWTASRGRIVANDICIHANTIFFGGNNDGNICVEAYNLSGEAYWSCSIGIGTGSTISDTEVGATGYLYVVGTIGHDSEPDEMLLSRFNLNGIIGQYDLSQWGAFRGDQVKRNAAGELFVTGRGVTDTIRSLLFKLSANGDMLWAYSSTDPFSYPWGDIAPAADGGCFLCDGLDGVRLRKISAEGQLEWDSTYANLPLPGYVVRSTGLESGDVVMAYLNYYSEAPDTNIFVKLSPAGDILLSRMLVIADTAYAFNQISLSSLGDQVVSVNNGLGITPLIVLDSNLDSLWSFSPVRHGLYWGDVTAAGSTASGNVAFAMFDYDGGGHFAMLGNPLRAPDAYPDLPRVISLGAYPNPFNATTTLMLRLTGSTHIKLTLVDVLGRRVVELSDGPATAGDHHYTFDGTGLSSGVYFAHLNAGEISKTVKLVLMK